MSSRSMTSNDAAKALGMSRPLFATVVSFLQFAPERQEAGQRGGTPRKLYGTAQIELLSRFFGACNQEGGETIIRRLLGEKP